MAKVSYDSVKHYKKKFDTVYSEIEYQLNYMLAQATDTISKGVKTDHRFALDVAKRRDRKRWGDNIDVTSGGKQTGVFNANRIEIEVIDSGEPETG